MCVMPQSAIIISRTHKAVMRRCGDCSGTRGSSQWLTAGRAAAQQQHDWSMLLTVMANHKHFVSIQLVDGHHHAAHDAAKRVGNHSACSRSRRSRSRQEAAGSAGATGVRLWQQGQCTRCNPVVSARPNTSPPGRHCTRGPSAAAGPVQGESGVTRPRQLGTGKQERTRIFDDFSVTIAQVQCVWQQVRESGVHACDHHHPADEIIECNGKAA